MIIVVFITSLPHSHTKKTVSVTDGRCFLQFDPCRLSTEGYSSSSQKRRQIFRYSLCCLLPCASPWWPCVALRWLSARLGLLGARAWLLCGSVSLEMDKPSLHSLICNCILMWVCVRMRGTSDGSVSWVGWYDSFYITDAFYIMIGW